jgi:Na+/H+ antiporter NhaD/arsenite permease-like protein
MTRIEIQNLIRELAMILVGITSLWLTKPELRAANGFDWEPIKEVAKTLAAISLGVVFMGVNTYIGNARELYGLCDSAAHRGKHARFRFVAISLRQLPGCS